MNHGTLAAFNAGCPCDGCRLMAIVGSRRRPVQPPPPPGFVDPEPFAEVIRRIHTAGLSLRDISHFTGVGYTTIRELHQGNAGKLQRGTAECLRDRLLQLLPSDPRLDPEFSA